MATRSSTSSSSGEDPRTPDTTADSGVKPAAAPAPGRTRDDAGDPSTYGFRSLADAPETEDNGPGAGEPQRVPVTDGRDENGNSTFGSRAASRASNAKGTPAGAENKAVDRGLIRSQPADGGGTTGSSGSSR